MANNIKWPKDVRDRAKADGKRLVAFGCEGFEAVGMGKKEKVAFMSLFYVHFICNDQSLSAALAETKKAYPEQK